MQTTINYGLKKPEGNDTVSIADLNYNAAQLDLALTPTADPAQNPSGNGPGKLVQWVSWMANRIKSITGKTNWYDTPDISLSALNTHANRHQYGGVDPLTVSDSMIGNRTITDTTTATTDTATLITLVSMLGYMIKSITGKSSWRITPSSSLENVSSFMNDYTRNPVYVVDSGSANAYVVTLSPAPSAYVDGMIINIKISNTSTSTAATINVNGLGTKNIYASYGTGLRVGDLAANSIYTLVYYSSSFYVLGGNIGPICGQYSLRYNSTENSLDFMYG
jgi:hypothetical protein